MVDHPLNDFSIAPQPTKGQAAPSIEWSKRGLHALAPHLGLLGSKFLLPSRLQPLFRRMGQQEKAHREQSLRIMLDAALAVPCAAEAWDVFQAMLQQGMSPSPTQLRGIRAVCALGGQVVRAWDAHSRLAKAEHPSGPRAAVLPSWGSLLRDAPQDLLPFVEPSLRHS